jgi:hypothetical protein
MQMNVTSTLIKVLITPPDPRNIHGINVLSQPVPESWLKTISLLYIPHYTTDDRISQWEFGGIKNAGSLRTRHLEVLII